MADHDDSGDNYHPKDAIAGAIKATLVTGSAGLFISTVQNTLSKQNVGAFGVFSRFGSTTAIYAAMGGAYEFTKNASANLRRKDDAWNSTWGGMVAGTLLGLRCLFHPPDSGRFVLFTDQHAVRSAPAVFGYGSALAVLLGTFTYTGGSLIGFRADNNVDEVSRKEELRKNRRKPIEEIVNELGEGRGIYGPGYEERRAQRIKDAYGIEVPANRPTAI